MAYLHFLFPGLNFSEFFNVFTLLRLGAGVVGIVNIPLEIMEPSHNKQEFLNVQEYNHLLRVMGQYLVQYCKDTGISEYSVVIIRDSGESTCVISLIWNDCSDLDNQ